MPINETILVTGAGIGGLALCCALQQARREYELYERAPSIGEVGSGIMVPASAMAALRHLGLDAEVSRAGAVLQRGTGRTVAGTVLHSTPLDALDSPTVVIHRARLEAILRASVDSSRIHVHKEAQRYEQGANGVQLFFTDGTSAHGSALVGADGLHSNVRRQMLGDTPLRYAGYTSWRGVAPRAGLTPDGEIIEIWGRGLRVGIAPMGAGETYWFAVANAPEGQSSADERADVIERFRSFGEPVSTLLEATPAQQIIRTDIHDRKPVNRWSEGRVVLLGDAAHPSTPNLGQGGGMAIEDAVVLAHLLSKQSFEEAVGEYQRRRIPRTTAIINDSWRFGRLAQLEGRVSTWLRDTILRMTPPNVVEKKMRESAKFSLDE
jgi:2-polyprenyl-6-methoxyphenol hydroxylase-like FAD-dependent oxidoreductase